MPILKQFEQRSVSIPNATAQHPDLSIAALGALTQLASYSDNYQFKIEWLQKRWGLGRDRTKAILAELRHGGFLKYEAARNEQGQMSGQIWWISTSPSFLGHISDDHEPESSSAGEPVGTENKADNKKEESFKKNGNEDSVPNGTGDFVAAPESQVKQPSGFQQCVDYYLQRLPKPLNGHWPRQLAALKRMLEAGASVDLVTAELQRSIDDSAGGTKFAPGFTAIENGILTRNHLAGISSGTFSAPCISETLHADGTVERVELDGRRRIIPPPFEFPPIASNGGSPQ
jgi:hypothetical protein